MAAINSPTMRLLHALSLLILVSSAGASIGVNYGTSGDNLPTPTQAVALLKKSGVTQARIYDTNPSVLNAFQGSNIQLMVGVRNDEIVAIGQDNATAYKWVNDHIVPYASKCNITGIAVGNEVLSYDSSEAVLLLPAMKLIHTALVSYALDGMMKVTTPCSTDLLVSKFPPSTGAFSANLSKSTMEPMLDFLSACGSFFMLNVYPHKEYQKNQQNMSLEYALFQSNPGVVDSATGFLYTNAFDSLLDATYAALAKLNRTDLQILISETGWPSQGEAYEKGLSPSNAQTYNANLIKHVLSKVGSPGRPGVLIITYVYELFNEDKRQGPLSTRNMGLFSNDMAPVYAVDLSGSGIMQVTSPPTASATRTWCVAKQDATQDNLQAALDYACGLGAADCLPIQPGQACFLPNTRASHASYAMNSYFQKNPNSVNACNFQGTATITTKDPSYSNCTYPSSTHLNSGQRSSSGDLAPRSTVIFLLSAAIVLLFGAR
ncbi:hypothetical protein KC19_2G217700 [Ceratodon purpureus]|uniref:glucan endo-1,3-beta-D-glucosidase n=1 Tax=Ceratodon purpureus TaxID=3225 RepID=A0A8T0IYQ2_CERPU|nr:hypothetical protein KC19_2G217700 [Ceratodon purpureus]